MPCNRTVPQENDNLINFIASTVEGLRGQVESISERMATKDDLARLESQMATRIDTFRDETKADIARLEGAMATRVDLARVESNLTRVESKLETKTTAMRGDIEQVQLRLDSIDHAVSTRVGMVETEVSRLHSVVYLLVKANPDMLRLLG